MLSMLGIISINIDSDEGPDYPDYPLRDRAVTPLNFQKIDNYPL